MMRRFKVGDRVSVKDATQQVSSQLGTVIEIPWLSTFDQNPEQEGRTDDLHVYVLRLDDGSVRRFTGSEIEPE